MTLRPFWLTRSHHASLRAVRPLPVKMSAQIRLIFIFVRTAVSRAQMFFLIMTGTYFGQIQLDRHTRKQTHINRAHSKHKYRRVQTKQWKFFTWEPHWHSSKRSKSYLHITISIILFFPLVFTLFKNSLLRWTHRKKYITLVLILY